MSLGRKDSITWGLAVLLVSSVLGLVYEVLRVVSSPKMFTGAGARDFGAWMLAASSSRSWGVMWWACIAAIVLGVPGGLALYRYFGTTRLERLARVGFILSTIGNLLWMPLLSFVALTGETASRYPQAALSLVATLFEGPGGLVMLLASLAKLFGSACSGAAMWRSGTLPRWTGPAITFAVILVVVPMVLPQLLVAGALRTAVCWRVLWAAVRNEFPDDRAALAASAARI